jgi:hypothetical protein
VWVWPLILTFAAVLITDTDHSVRDYALTAFLTHIARLKSHRWLLFCQNVGFYQQASEVSFLEFLSSGTQRH